MANFRILCFFLSSIIFFYHRSASAFLVTTASSTTRPSSLSPILPYHDSTFFVLHADFKQLPGESSTAFIKRITSQSSLLDQQKSKTNNVTMSLRNNSSSSRSSNETNSNDENNNENKPTGKYQRIEEWDAEQTANKGELSWEERVQFEGQRHGNQVKQHSILRRHLGTF